MNYETNVGKIVKFSLNYKDKKQRRKRSYNPNRKMAPWDSRLKQRYDTYASSRRKGYNFFRIKGIAIHEAINNFKESGLERIIARIGEDGDPVKLWYSMKYYAYHSLLTCCENMIEGGFSEIEYHKESIIQEGKCALESHLGTLLNRIVYRMNRGQSLIQILRNYIQILQEKTLFYTIKDTKIFFKPDWVEFDPDSIFLVDFKSNKSPANSQVHEKDRIQMILFSYLLEKRFFPKKVRKSTVHYLGNDEKWNLDFSDEDRLEAKNIINRYIIKNSKENK